jgi:anti-sigma factor RsiW
VTCRQFADFIADYLSGELPSAARETFERHLERCENCHIYLTIYQDTVRLGRRAFDGADDEPLPREVPDRLVTAILAARRQGIR